MADVDFGDRELFQQLEDSAPPIPKHIRFSDDNGEDGEDSSQLRNKLEEYETNIERLSEENRLLRRKLHILTRPSGISIEDVNIDGPLLQILFTNNIISKQCRQEIEDCIFNVILKHQKPGNKKTTVFHSKPQNSAFALDEDPEKMSSSSVKTTSEAFKVVGSVLYFATFNVDKLGQPLVNENPQLTDGWEIPTYFQVFNQVIGTDGQEIEMKDKRPKSMCFNCGSGSHQLRDCPTPKDMAAINERRREFNQNMNQAAQSNQRYHADEVEERFSRFKPGVMSEELLTALGVDSNSLPPLIYRMRQLGYPPGWLKEAEMENSGLSLYDGNVSNDDNGTDDVTPQNISYDVTKLVDFPGFNVAAPYEMRDEFMHYDSIPMQTSHMKQNYAAYLSSNFPVPGATSNKRQRELDSSPQRKKKNKPGCEASTDRGSDMDVESDPGTSYLEGAGDFQFQSPLPRNSPCLNSPPPLPQGTPPSTPTPPPLPKGTPPRTPSNGSPALQRSNWTVTDEALEAAEDEMTLEELEEQQRLIWAALENADTATSSDCETPVLGTPAASSPSVSTPVHIDTKMEELEEVKAVEPFESVKKENEPRLQESLPQSPVSIKQENDSPESPDHLETKNDHSHSLKPVSFQDYIVQSPDPELSDLGGGDSSPKQDHEEKITAVPHRSKFAAGIVQFEDTPEFTEVAEATGTYLKIRDLLKSSPRSLSKKK